jgi:hypothetical protein
MMALILMMAVILETIVYSETVVFQGTALLQGAAKVPNPTTLVFAALRQVERSLLAALVVLEVVVAACLFSLVPTLRLLVSPLAWIPFWTLKARQRTSSWKDSLSTHFLFTLVCVKAR